MRLLLLLGVSLAVLLLAVLGNSSMQALYATPPEEASHAELQQDFAIKPVVEAASAELEKFVAGAAADLAFLNEDPFAHSDMYISDALERSQDRFVTYFVDQLDVSLEDKEELMPNVTGRFEMLREHLDRALNASRGRSNTVTYLTASHLVTLPTPFVL